MQETQVWSLVQEDPICCGAPKPVCHNYWAWSSWARALELQLLKSAHPRACAPQQEKPQQWEICAPQLEKSPHSSKDPTQPKINKITKNIPWTEEPGGLQSTGSQRIRHDWETKHTQGPLHPWKDEKEDKGTSPIHLIYVGCYDTDLAHSVTTTLCHGLSPHLADGNTEALRG